MQWDNEDVDIEEMMEDALVSVEMEQNYNTTSGTHQENTLTSNDQQEQKAPRLPFGDSDHDDLVKTKDNSFNVNSARISNTMKENHDQQLHQQCRSHNGIVAMEDNNSSRRQEQSLVPSHSERKREIIKTSRVNVLEMSNSKFENVTINIHMDAEKNPSRMSNTETNRIRESKPRQNALVGKRDLNTSHTKLAGTLGTASKPIELDGDPPTHSLIGKYKLWYLFI